MLRTGELSMSKADLIIARGSGGLALVTDLLDILVFIPTADRC